MLNKFLESIKKDRDKYILIGNPDNCIQIVYTDLGQDSIFELVHIPSHTQHIARSYDVNVAIAYVRNKYNVAELYRLGDIE